MPGRGGNDGGVGDNWFGAGWFNGIIIMQGDRTVFIPTSNPEAISHKTAHESRQVAEAIWKAKGEA